MKQRVFFIVLLFLFFSLPMSSPQASCIIGSGKPVSANISFQTFGDDGSNLTVNGKSFFRNKPQCTSPQPSRSYTISCDEATETLAADSLFAPLCGSSEERGKTNSSCWQCGGTVKCDGLDWAVGSTDEFFRKIHNPVSPGDTNTDQVWRIPNGNIPNDGFTYNGQHYDKPGGDLIACGSNNLACGSSEECTNIKHPDVNNRGRSGQQQCTAYSYTRLSLIPGSSSGASDTVKIGGDKACINIGDYSSHFNELSRAAETFPNGWIYILALPEWMDSISTFIKDHPSNNFMIRLHHPNAELSPDYANRWVTNLKTYAGNITNKVYLMPVNEPNNIDPNRHVEADAARVFISALSQGLDNEGLLNTKYIVTSPMIDPTSSDVTGWLGDFCADDEFCKQFAAVAVAPYDVTGDMSNITSYFPGASMIAAETGIKRGDEVVYGLDSETADFLHSVKDSWGKSAIAACIFSYDPDRNTNQEWIYSASQTQQALRGLGQSIKPIAAPQVIQPKTERSTISYESCTEAGVPKIPSKTRIPNLISPERQNSNPKKYTVTGVTFPKSKIIKGEISLADNILKYPIMSTFANILDRAMAPLQPLAIQLGYQKIVHPLTITADTKVCVESEDGEVRARPIKNDIRTEYKDLNKLVGATPFFASILGLKKLTKYEQNNMAKLHPDLAPGGGFDDCPDPPQALSVREMAGSSGGAQFEVPEEKSPIYRTASRWLPQGVLDNISKLLCLVGGSADCNTDFDPQYYLNIDLINPFMAETNDLIGVDNQTGKHTGFVNSFAPGVLQKFLGNDPGKIFHKVNQSLGSNFEAVGINLNTVNAQGIQTHERFLRCAITPQSKQYGDTCTFTDVRIPNTSDWAIDGGPTISSDFTPQTGSIQEAITKAAQSEQVPQCALEAVGYIEGAYNWKENDPRQQSCPRNICSAAGPFQITTGVDGKGDASCSACDSSWVKKNGCPNTWGNRPGDPCSNYEYAAQISAQILKGKVSYGSEGALSLTNADPRSQKDAIILAGNGYYGGDAPVPRLGGCSYGEFVYKRCDPTYTCAQQIKR